jgi:IS5 family transposase
LACRRLPGNPYDGHTLTGQIEQVERLTGVTVERAYVDRGYKGHKHGGKAKVYIAHTRGIASPTIKRELRRRNAIEPIIGHTKSDGLLERNQLAGATGDAINAILVAAGHNLRLLVAWLTALLRACSQLGFPLRTVKWSQPDEPRATHRSNLSLSISQIAFFTADQIGINPPTIFK